MPGGMGSSGRGSNSDGDPYPSVGNAASGAVPPDIPRGDDDDIVAQQLRQAALEAKDPQEREKLWDEYRKYKGISRGEQTSF